MTRSTGQTGSNQTTSLPDASSDASGAPSPAPSTPLLIQRLLDPAAYPHPTGPIRLVETHISWVLLTGPFVYKLKKPVALGYLDFSSLERRAHFCREEVRLNQRFAPQLYLEALPITGSCEHPQIGGSGEPIEWAVKLVQFDDEDQLDRRLAASRLSVTDCQAVGAEIARIHARLDTASPAGPFGSPAGVFAIAEINLNQLRTCRPDTSHRVDALEHWLRHQLLEERPAGTRAAMLARLAAGKVRECHGDLHLANIVFSHEELTPFDSIEFNPALRWIDVASDIAFLGMDLESRGRPDLAAHATNAWIETSNDHGATAVLPLYKVARALVRAAVAAVRGSQVNQPAPASSQPPVHHPPSSGAAAAPPADTDRYLALAERLMQPPKPQLIVTSGVSGSGKTTVTTELVGGLGAVRLRSDVERKRLAGMAATARPADSLQTDSLYSPASTEQVYELLETLARTLLAAGSSVIIDAACNTRRQRERFTTLARATGTPLVWLDFSLPAEVVLARVAARAAAGTDASDASAAVVQAQLAAREALDREELLRAAPPGGSAATQIRLDSPAKVSPEAIAQLVQRLRGEPAPA